MLRSLEDFRASIENLLTHLKYEKSSNSFFRDGLKKSNGDTEFEVEFREFVETIVGDAVSRTKIYSYQNAIICLYGYLERFIEDIIVEYLKCVSEVCQDFTSLPKAIRKNHLSLSMDFINKIQRAKGWSPHDTKARLTKAVRNMNHFLAEEGEPKINYEAFTSHTSNFRYDTIHEIFTKIGIDAVSKQCLDDPELITALCEKHGLDLDTEPKIFISLLTAELDDLAQRRNEIAHGVRIDEIDSIDLTISRINLILSYANAIGKVIELSITEHLFSVSNKFLIGKPDCIFPRINVIGFSGIKQLAPNGSTGTITVGDTIIAVNQNSSTKHIHGKIVSLKHNGNDRLSVPIPCDEDVSMQLNFEPSGRFQNRSVYLLFKDRPAAATVN
ncbi:HEPN domain-containing protein [Pseudomonas sp. B21-035]|uniref:HEPN domain-containing protein n=1 Tax=Pseudomonas sp. B21-035 TaxID=2895484 RepID=UPI002161072A|nr:MAE_28990/MAE_18760 family HEPN-like nuclease [Pseudomonas sp. B21-035]UVL54712.1 hypothetical protein LOY22_17825 [Pseudomonas sp. B21-035]